MGFGEMDNLLLSVVVSYEWNQFNWLLRLLVEWNCHCFVVGGRCFWCLWIGMRYCYDMFVFWAKKWGALLCVNGVLL